MLARWITAEAPWHAAVIASMSVTEARITSSAGPAVMSAMSSRRRVRSGRASRGRSMVPIPPAAPVMRIVGTPANITRSPRRYWGLGSGSGVAPARARNSKSQPSLAWVTCSLNRAP